MFSFSYYEPPIFGSHNLEQSADYMQGTRMNFKTKEDAIHFAEKQGEQMPTYPALIY